jgi:hypothetical protein
MNHVKTFLIAGVTTAVFMAIIFRVPPLRKLVTNSAT